MAEKVVYAKDSLAWGTSDGITGTMYAGEVWSADALIVRERPELFADEPPVRTSDQPTPRRVERATRTPGERR